jgi:Holliday junction resolvase
MNQKPDGLEYLIYEVLQKLGLAADADKIAKGVQRLQIGLPAEDEFSAILGLLGRCQLVHKLDQGQFPPESRSLYQVPDLIAIFDYHGRSIPVLIEVKTEKDATVSWRPDYRERLQRYADTLGLPLLVAWRHKTLWTLFDVRHLAKATTNFNIKFTEAIKQTLMCELAGDFSFSFKSGTGAHIKMKKLNKTEGGFEVVIEDAYFANADGQRFADVPGLFQLFLCLDHESVVVEEESHFLQSFMSISANAEFGHRALATLLRFATSADTIHWREILEKNNVPPVIEAGLKAAAKQAEKVGFVEHCLHVKPVTMPDFLSKYPPAKPGALVREPLKAARRGR